MSSLQRPWKYRKPVVYATFVVIAVFLPELFSTSVQGHFLDALALAFILAVLASLLVSITAMPALSATLAPDRAGPIMTRGGSCG